MDGLFECSFQYNNQFATEELQLRYTPAFQIASIRDGIIEYLGGVPTNLSLFRWNGKARFARTSSALAYSKRYIAKQS